MGGFKINRSAIRDMSRAIEQEFARNRIRVPIHAGPSRAAPDVSWSELELVAGWLLDWLLIFAGREPNAAPDVEELIRVTNNEALRPVVNRQAQTALELLVSAGLVKLHMSARSLLSAFLLLTPEGRREATVRLEGRKNVKERRGASREAVLRWVYESTTLTQTARLSTIALEPYGWYLGERFAADELAAAADHLRGVGLLRGPDDELSLTDEGITCIERYGDLVSYLNRGDSAGISVVFQGDNNGQLAIAMGNVTQRQKQSVDPKVLGVVAQALREFASLVPDDADSYNEVAQLLEREVQKEEPDQGWTKSLLDRARVLLTKANKVSGVAQLAGLGLQVMGMTGDAST